MCCYEGISWFVPNFVLQDWGGAEGKNQVTLKGRRVKNEAEKSWKMKILKKFLTAGKTWKAIFWPASGWTDSPYGLCSSGFSAEEDMSYLHTLFPTAERQEWNEAESQSALLSQVAAWNKIGHPACSHQSSRVVWKSRWPCWTPCPE